jgi:hypothetical protein
MARIARGTTSPRPSASTGLPPAPKQMRHHEEMRRYPLLVLLELLAGVATALIAACGSTSTNSPPADGAAPTESVPVVDGAAADDAAAPADATNGPASVEAGSPGTPAADGATTGIDAGAKPCPGAKPDATNTGVPPGVALTTVAQDVVVTQDGTVIDAEDIQGFLTIKASHVTVMRSIVRGRATSATTAIVRIDSGTDITIEDVEIAAATPSVDVDGFSAQNVVARRLNIHGGVDGAKVGSNTTLECSYIHDLVSFASDPNQGGGATHNDAIQILSGTGIHIVGNQLVAAMDQNSAIQITEDFGVVSDVHIESNWADGGGCTYNFSHKGQTSLGDLHTQGNRFGRNSFYNCPILKSTKTTLDSQGDVWDDDGTPVPIQTHD